MKTNYFKVHKNKKPKKVNYSKPYTKKEKEEMDNIMDELYDLFKKNLHELRTSINENNSL